MIHDILLVDDDPINLAVLQEIFSGTEFHTRPAQSGLDALRLVAEQPPDIILLDVMMPRLDGFETCTRLKDNPATAEIPVLFLTASNDLQHKLHGFSCGGADYIVKPFDAAEVMVRVQTQLKLRDAQKTIRRHNEQLEEMLQERTRDLIKTERQAAFSLLMEGIIHNLRGPLTAVMGLSDCVLMEVKKQADAPETISLDKTLGNIRADAEYIGLAARELNDMINSLMVKSRNDKSAKREDLNLNDLLAADLKFMNSNLRFKHQVKKEVRFSECPLPIRVVHSEISLVFSNLLRNALDATFKKSQPVIAIESGLDEEGGMAWFAVSDNGPGIPEDLRNSVFDPFFTTKPRADQVKGDEPSGTGIGLYTVAQIARSHQGDVSVGDSGLGGARFVVRLPLAKKTE